MSKSHKTIFQCDRCGQRVAYQSQDSHRPPAWRILKVGYTAKSGFVPHGGTGGDLCGDCVTALHTWWSAL